MELDLGAALATSVEKIGDWVEALVQNLPEIVAALVLVVAFWLLARGVRRVVRRVMTRVTDHGPLRGLAGTASYLAVLGTGVFLALGILQLDRTVTSLLAGVGILGLALGFAFQDIAENFIAGVVMSVRRPFTDGDLVETAGYRGTVEGVNLRATLLRTPRGQLVRIPNGEVFGSALTNYTTGGPRRVDLGCGVSYGDDLERARKTALEAVSEVPGLDPSREPELFWEEFGGSSINFVVRFWIRSAAQRDYLAARSAAIEGIKDAFDERGVGIPFPIVTLDFSEAGGRLLDEPLRAFGAGSA